ncbi:MAG: glycosyltransferase family 2 protein [Caldilineaceae bacterium]|nr:glycosyltransferase family 2 protein [Caldilineaceae bacterium]
MAPATNSPRVTVIIATYNSSKTLTLALQSLLAQDFTDFEAWVVGDACTDDSAQVVASFGDERLYWTNLPQNSGSQGGPNNEGLRRALGEYVAYLGHDDLWFPWHLSGLVAHIENSQADLVHPLSAVHKPEGLAAVVGPPGEGKNYAEHFVFPSSWLHRRDLVQECGGWRDASKLSVAVDFDLQRRICYAGKRIEYCPQLSVLKFPSPYWRIYAWQGVPPQQEYLQRMRETPQAFHQQQLLEIATLCARQSAQWYPMRRTLGDMTLRMRRKLIKLYGRDRAPLRQLLVWEFQRQRRMARKKRGLS